MKKFYTLATVEEAAGTWRVLLDGRAVKTPGRAQLAVPTRPLGELLVSEWQAQGEKIDPATMPATGFANAAIDRVGTDRAAFVTNIAAYGESDMLCYRADTGSPLAAKQAQAWDPLLEWAQMRYGIVLRVTEGIVHVVQPDDTLARLRLAVEAENDFVLAAMAVLTSVSGSLVVALALLERAFETDRLWAISCLEESWQEEHWGIDAEAVRARKLKKAQFDAAARFCMVARAAGN